METLRNVDLEELSKELSQYHIRLLGYAKQAHRELKHNIARLFEAVSFSKQVQVLYLMKCLGNMGDTKANISACIGNAGINDYIETDRIPCSDNIIEKFDEIEERNRHLYCFAEDAARLGKDAGIGDIHVCSVCGYVLAGSLQEHCPVCSSVSGYFRIF